MRISDWSSDVCSSDLALLKRLEQLHIFNEHSAAELARSATARLAGNRELLPPVGCDHASVHRHWRILITPASALVPSAIIPKHVPQDRKSTRLNSSP